MGSGARYVDWTHIHVAGSRDAAAPHVPYARKLLGFVMDEAQRNSLGTAKIERTLEDGTRVIAEKHGDIPRVTIIPSTKGTVRRESPRGDFVVWARNAAYPDGIDIEHPQQILQDDGSWRTYFFSASPTHDAFPGAKGTYSGMFPDGIKHAGNVDWTNGDQRLSWYGPSTRYWTDPWVQPRTQFGHQVFMLGQIVLDTTEGDTPAAEPYVMGAAIDGMDLYVMQADLPVGTTTTADQPANTILIDAWHVPGDIPHALYRYSLLPDPAAPGHMLASPDSRELIWSASLPTGAMPWFFNKDGTRGRCHGVSGGNVGSTDIYFRPLAGPEYLPEPTSPYWELQRTGDAASLLTYAASVTPNGEDVLASDYDGYNLVNVTVRRYQTSGGGSIGADLRGDHWLVDEVELYGVINLGGGYENRNQYVVFADARAGLLVTAYEVINTITAARSVTLQIRMGGELLHSEVVTTAAPSAATGVHRNPSLYSTQFRIGLATDTINPMWALFGWTYFSQGIGVYFGFTGAHIGNMVLPYQAGEYFGGYREGHSSPGPMTIVADQCSVTPAREKLDFDGKDSVFSAATLDKIVMLSGYGFEQDTLESKFYVTGATLPDLTGVGGANTRFHPLWILGKPHPATEAA